MIYRRMGSLDWEVSALGFGCMRLPTEKIKDSYNFILYLNNKEKGLSYKSIF